MTRRLHRWSVPIKKNMMRARMLSAKCPWLHVDAHAVRSPNVFAEQGIQAHKSVSASDEQLKNRGTQHNSREKLRWLNEWSVDLWQTWMRSKHWELNLNWNSSLWVKHWKEDLSMKLMFSSNNTPLDSLRKWKTLFTEVTWRVIHRIHIHKETGRNVLMPRSLVLLQASSTFMQNNTHKMMPLHARTENKDKQTTEESTNSRKVTLIGIFHHSVRKKYIWSWRQSEIWFLNFR